MSNQHGQNNLIHEQSPYLLQHADNPVEWYPWGDAAFQKAKAEDKLIFLSIGYSTCHWCHVMAHESFEDEEVARLMNEHFVSIKVDREERPDVDSIYMSVCQALTGEGGWPLTVLMTPDKHPFFAGTYFPKNRKYGRLGLMELLPRLVDEWHHNRERVESSGQRIVDAISSHYAGREARGEDELSESLIHEAFQSLQNEFDEGHGGFGHAPKFPIPHQLSFLLRYHELTGNHDALQMVTKTLDAMHEGGIWDHVGFGFSRYSVDDRWEIPHFEKMLYDNALLAIAYLEAFQVTEDPRYAQTARRIFEYVRRDMLSPEGVFYCALDADSEGQEGKFYAWSAEEFREVVSVALPADMVDLVCEYYGITAYGNFDGHNVPNTIQRDKTAFCRQHEVSVARFDEMLADVREQLFEEREKRVHPHLDDKVLSSWNGLMIAAFAKGAQVLREADYATIAIRAADFILQRMRSKDGRLFARYRDGKAGIPAYLDDYAFLTWGLIELYEATFEARHLQVAIELSSHLQEYFHDDVSGGFFLTAKDNEELIARPKEIYDGALPSGNSVAARNLFRLGRLTGNPELERRALDSISAFADQIVRYPSGYTYALMALLFEFFPGQEIVIVGRVGDRLRSDMIDAVQERLLPASVWVVKDPDEVPGSVLPYLSEYGLVGDRSTAYVCHNFTCDAPTSDLERLREQLDTTSRH